MEKLIEKLANLFAPKYTMLDAVYNKDKKCVQVVLSVVPFDRKGDFGVPKTKRAYICSDLAAEHWTVELGENLRKATIYDKLNAEK
jgi:hypothetical protein